MFNLTEGAKTSILNIFYTQVHLMIGLKLAYIRLQRWRVLLQEVD